MKKRDQKKYRDNLNKLKELALGGLEHIERETLNRSLRDSSGDLSGYSIHLADAASDAAERELALNLASREQNILYEIDDALARIDEGTFGTCEMCECEIGLKRLKAVPYARMCIKCQKEYEARQRGGQSSKTQGRTFREGLVEDIS